MKIEKRDLEKINEILKEAQLATEVPCLLFALKQEASPQFEIRFIHPQHYQKIFKDLFIFSINPLIEKVYKTQTAEITTNIQQGLKNLLNMVEIDTSVREFGLKAFGVVPLVMNQDVVGFLIFLSMLTSEKFLKIMSAYVAQIRYYLQSKENVRLAREANSRVKMFMESSPFAFFTIDTQGNHVYVSPGIEQLTGYTQNEFLRGLVKPEKLIHEEDLNKFMNFYGRALGGTKGDVEFRLRRKDGNVIWIALSSKPLYDTDGKLIGVQAVERDVTERKKAELELEEKVEKDKLKTEFMSVVSHELRTPVTPIQGYAEILLSEKPGPLTDQQKSIIHIMKSNSKRLLDLIDSVLDITRVEYGKSIEVKKEPVSLNAIVDEVVVGSKFLFDERGIKFNVELSPDVETVLADEAKISRVMANLIGNALKFTPKKGRVKVRTSKEGSDLKFEISDTGIGIEKENLTKVFDKFFQVDSSYTRAAGGIGMGLTLVKEIVESHGGKAWAESDGLGKGSKFIFTLPLS